MRRLLLIAAVSALALARPETYREKEDFQYSRSSSDEGTKSGFYGAQRGNMGGNYERAHNMDGVAQHQMGSAIRQVEGEVGDTSAINKGRVFTAGSTRGVYGQGNYNLDNLSGRNFQESGAGADSLTHSSFSNGHSGFGSRASSQTAGFGSGYESYKGRNSGYRSGQFLEDQNREALNNLQYGRQAAGGSAYSQSEYNAHSAYNQAQSVSSQNGYTKSRVVPVRVVMRPGSTVNVPVNAEAYDNTYRGSAYDQNAINSDAEVLSNTDSVYRVPKPTTAAKHYESEYKYRKEWEKHDSLPAATPLVIPGSPVPQNSELYEDSVGSTKSAAHGFRSSAIGSQNQLEYANAGSNHQSKYQSGYKGVQSKTAGAHSSGTYNNLGSSADLINSGDVDSATAPKSYQSSYSYKKSWERQGDPYVIVPVGENTESQRLTAASNRQASGYRSHQYGTHAAQSRYSHAEGEDCDCDEEGNVRVVRSVGDQEDLGQQTQQVQSSDFEELGQQPISQNLEDFGQLSQNKWDAGQQTQNSWQQVSSFQKPHNKPNKVEDLTQHTQSNQNKFEDFTQQSQSQNLEDLGQQVQSGWDDSANLGQQTQNGWYAEDLFRTNGKVNTSRHETQNVFKPTERHQLTSDNLNNFGNLNSQIQSGQTGGQTGGDSQQTQNGWYAEDLFRQPRDKLHNIGNERQQNRNLQEKTEDLGQQTQNAWYGEETGQRTLNQWKPLNYGKTTEKYFGLYGTNTQSQQGVPSLTNPRKPATTFNAEDLFKPSWEQSKQNSDSLTDWSKFDDIYSSLGKINKTNLNNGEVHSQGTDDYSFQQSSQNWGNVYGESSHSVQSHSEVQYQFINKKTTESNTAYTTTESNQNKYPWEITTRRQWTGSSVFDHTTKRNKDQYPWVNNNEAKPTTPSFSAGRGDIDGSDSYQAFSGVKPTPKALNPEISIVQNKPFKTPAEIEALSLTKDSDKPKTDVFDASINSNTNRQADDGLRVVGLNQQWLEEQKRNGQAFQSENRNNQQQSQGQNEDFGQQVVQTNWNTNDNQYQSHNQAANVDQQSQTNWNTNERLHQSQAHDENVGQVVQTNWNSNHKLHQTQEQTEDLGQQMQTSWNSDNLQQSQNEDLGQQIQSGWNPNEKLTQSDPQKSNDFYSEHHQLHKNQEESAKVEAQTISATPEITTKAPGFWKKVGGKVSSWFGG